MELCSLRSVQDCLRKPAAGRPMSVALLCDFAVQVADAMAYLENRRIVHRSLAARNVLMSDKDKVCMMPTDRTDEYLYLCVGVCVSDCTLQHAVSSCQTRTRCLSHHPD